MLNFHVPRTLVDSEVILENQLFKGEGKLAPEIGQTLYFQFYGVTKNRRIDLDIGCSYVEERVVEL